MIPQKGFTVFRRNSVFINLIYHCLITFVCIVNIHFDGIMSCHCDFTASFNLIVYISFRNVISFICIMFVSLHYRDIDFVGNIQLKQHQNDFHLSTKTSLSLSPSPSSCHLYLIRNS